jgi:dCTP deaminase
VDKIVQGGILTGNEIKREVENTQNIQVHPWDPTHLNYEDKLNPASYDLTLGDEVAVYKAVTLFNHAPEKTNPLVAPIPIPFRPEPPRAGVGDGECIFADPNGRLNVKAVNHVWKFKIDPKKGWLLKPGIGYLMHTVERVRTDKYVPVLDGKSTIGRLFVTAHITAGFGDPGFDGQYTLEVVSTYPITVFPFMRFCQIRFHTQVGEPVDYQSKGTYKGELAKGPIPSYSWKQFQKT